MSATMEDQVYWSRPYQTTRRDLTTERRLSTAMGWETLYSECCFFFFALKNQQHKTDGYFFHIEQLGSRFLLLRLLRR